MRSAVSDTRSATIPRRCPSGNDAGARPLAMAVRRYVPGPGPGTARDGHTRDQENLALGDSATGAFHKNMWTLRQTLRAPPPPHTAPPQHRRRRRGRDAKGQKQHL